jgi:hypothetical protein
MPSSPGADPSTAVSCSAHESATTSARPGSVRSIAPGWSTSTFTTCVTRSRPGLVQRGASLQEVKDLLGHRSLAMTLRYGHLAPEHLRSAVARHDTTLPALDSAQETRVEEPLLSKWLSLLVRLAGVEPATLGLEDEGRQRAGPQSFCIVRRNGASLREFSLLAFETQRDSRCTRGLKSACRTGAFSANQRKPS